ncbi:hypothetical protein ACFWB1_26605 [Streptomyces goshikiensis]|uniref:hypothetical protein n=1 Tax=Streptomyces goshikiensis TaxID=1942 RepID=UPI003694DAA1
MTMWRRRGAAAAALAAAVFLAGCGTESDSAEPDNTASSGVSRKQQANRDKIRAQTNQAAQDVQTAMVDAGMHAVAVTPPLGVATVEAAHPQDTALSALTAGFDNLAKKGWERQKTGKQTTITAKKGGCTALADGTFSHHRSETKPGDVDVIIGVRCELH